MANVQNKKGAKKVRLRWAEYIYVNLPFVCFCALLAVIYIFNAHASERSLRKMDALKKEVKDYRWQYMNLKQDIMYGSTQSQLSDHLAKEGLKPLDKVPNKLILKKENLK